MCLSRRLRVLVPLGLLLAACGGPGEDPSLPGDTGRQGGEHPTREERAGDERRVRNAHAPSADAVGGGAAATTVPALGGLTVEEARGALEGFDAPVQVVAFDLDATVTATYPAAGEQVAAEDALVVWLGVPPEPPDPEPTAGAGPAPAPAADTGEEPADATAGQEQDDGAERTSAGEGGGEAEDRAGLRPDEPQPARTSPRRMPRAERGTVLEGVASWYGPGFEGRNTACGGRYDSSEFTLATRELRCGTRVLVTHPSGATVEATATDWGPAEWTGRRFDLSRATFEALTPLTRGVVTVTVEVIG